MLDSTILDDAVATQDTVTQLLSAVARIARAVPGGARAVTEHATRLAAVTGHSYDHAGKPVVAWDDPSAQTALVDALVRDARAVLAAVLAAVGEQPPGPAADAVGLLALVSGQDVELTRNPDDPAGPGSWRIARHVAPDRVISTVDPEARHAHKTVTRRQDGFKAHVVVEPDTGLVTGCAVTAASGPSSPDGVSGLLLLGADPTIEAPAEVLADSAYATGAALAALDEAGYSATIKPWPLYQSIPGGFSAADFTVE